MALPRITQKEMTEREQRELKTLLDRARIAHGRVLTNSETNSIKKEYIDKLMVEREAEAKKARQLKKKQAYKPDPEASFSWSANTFTVGRRATAFFRRFFHLNDWTFDAYRFRFGLRFRFCLGRGIFNELKEID